MEIRNIKLSTYVEWLTSLYTILTIMWCVLSYLDLMPFYQVKLYKVNSLTPTVTYFPGQNLRLGFDFHEGSSKLDITSAKWSIIKDDKTLYQLSGLEPTITLPVNDGGIYQLSLVATTTDGTLKTGSTNVYVVQDKPKSLH